MKPKTPKVGIVLSGGGARGAYEAGVVAGIIEALGRRAEDKTPFHVISGTSVGAINGAFLAANAHRGDVNIHEMLRIWRTLELSNHLRIDLQGLVGWHRTDWKRLLGMHEAMPLTDRYGRSLLNPRGLEVAVQGGIDWAQLHKNVDDGVVHALVVAALHIGTGVTTMFAELSPTASFNPTKAPRRVAKLERIELEHVLASAAIPFVFPSRRVGESYFVDGGLRFNTPIAPAIRAGADKLIVVTLRYNRQAGAVDSEGDVGTGPDMSEQYPHLVFLLGKILNALLLDPVTYDLQILERFNRLAEVLDSTLRPAERARIDKVLTETRGQSYRAIETLVFEPSEDIGVMAGEHLRENLNAWRLGRMYDWALAKAANVQATWESDLASYLLFDGAFAERLIALGRRDALAKADRIREFYLDVAR